MSEVSQNQFLAKHVQKLKLKNKMASFLQLECLLCRTKWKQSFFPLEEGVWSLGGEAGLVLATQDPVGQGELDLGVLRRGQEEMF